MKKRIAIVTIILSLFCGIMLTACNDTGGSLLLSLNTQKIEMVLTDESATYEITVQNFGNREVSFDFGFQNNIAKIVDGSLRGLGGGKYQFSIAPISASETTLTISLRGTNKTIDVPVVVSDNLQSFSLSNDIFVIKGESIALNSSYFSFNPEETNLKGLSFALKEDQELENQVTWNADTNTLWVSSEATIDEVQFIATSEVLDVEPCEFSVKVVSEIDLTTTEILVYSLKNQTAYEEINFTYAYPYSISLGDSLENSYNPLDSALASNFITLITNEDLDYKKLIRVETAFDKYMVDVYASDGIIGDVNSTNPITQKDTNFNFEIQAYGTSAKGEPYKLTFRVYQADFPANYKEFSVNVYAINNPKAIRINNNITLPDVNLYHNNSYSSDFRFSVFPSLANTQNEEDYVYSIEIKGDAEGAEALDSYMTAKFGGTEIEFNETDNLLTLSNLDNLDEILSITPRNFYKGKFTVTVSCLKKIDEETTELITSNQFSFYIHKGTTTFGLNENYKNGVLYVPLNDETKDSGCEFGGFSFDKDSTIGELIISPKNALNTVCDIAYLGINIDGQVTPAIKITPKHVGEAEFNIETQNGISISLKIVVFREITQDNFSLQIDNTKQNSIYEHSTKTGYATAGDETNQTLANVVIKGIGNSAYIKDVISGFTDANENSYSYLLSLTAPSAVTPLDDDEINPYDYFEIIDNSRIISKNFTEKDETITVYVTLTLYTHNAYILGVKEEPITRDFSFTLSCIDYYKNLNITVSDGKEKSQKTKVMSVYDKNVLSYANQDLSVAYVYLDLQKSTNTINLTSQIKEFNWTIDGATKQSDGVLKVGSIGYFYLTEYKDGLPINGEDYIGKFVCDISGINTTNSFNITLTMTDDTGVTFTSTVTLNIDYYIDVESLYLTTATDTIYLDSTETYNEITFGTYLLPETAMNKDIQVFIDSTNINCISYIQNGNTLTFRYVSGGSGTIRIFPVSKMKTNSPKDEHGNYYYHIAIPFIAADGLSEDTPLKLSTYNDLINIKSNSHYYIDGIIDCGGNELYLPNFSGSIRGTFAKVPTSGSTEEIINIFNKDYQLGGISNFVVSYSESQHSGMIGTLNGKLSNLTISGKLAQNWELQQTISYVALLCGLNNGTISNVEVIVSDNDSSFKIKEGINNANAYIGFVAGYNQGTIEINNHAKNSTLMVNCADTVNMTIAESITSYIGGIVGYNSSSILNNFDKYSLSTIGNFGIHANVNILATNCDYLGAGIGYSYAGEVKNLKVTGIIENNGTADQTSGFIAYYNAGTITDNITRVFVRAESGNLAGLIGGYGANSLENITKNKVQAIDDGKEKINASMFIAKQDSTLNSITVNPLVKVLPDDNKAESYITRTVKEYAENINETLTKDFFYGIAIRGTGNSYVEITDIRFNTGNQTELEATNRSFALAVYKKAIEDSLQVNIDNNINFANVLSEIAKINLLEVNVEIDNKNLANIVNYGQGLRISGAGEITINLTSSLNFRNSEQLTIYLTNYFDNYKSYLDKDKTVATSEINLINTSNKNVYMGAKSSVYVYKNTPIYLMDNKEISFYVQEMIQDGDTYKNATDPKLNITTVGQTVTMSAKQNMDEASVRIHVYALFNAGENYYAYKDNGLNAYAFIKNKLENNYNPYDVNINTGIENIQIAKSSILSEPSNNVEIVVKYDSYNEDDYLNPSLVITRQDKTVIKTNFEWNTEKNFGTFKDGKNNNVFTIAKQTSQTNGNSVSETYVLTMVKNKGNYSAYKNCVTELTFTSNNTKESASVRVEYTPETITTVLVNNYSKEQNKEMIGKDADKLYDENKMLLSSSFTSTGEYNVLKAYVYTQLSEFDYLDVTMNVGVNGGYLGIGKNGLINSDILYTSINGVVSLRANHSDLIDEDRLFDGSLSMLEIVIVYSIPSTIPDLTKVPITLTFYKNTEKGAEVCYQKDVTVVAKLSNKVQFTILDKQAGENEEDYDQVYSIAKGMTYMLETNIVGYTDEEVVFESSNPNLVNVTNNNGVYYLNIKNVNLAYGEDAECYEVVITSYGRRVINNNVLTGDKQRTKLKIYEYLFHEDYFEDNKLSLRLLNKVDVRDVILDELLMEYANANEKQIVKFKETFKNSGANWSLLTNGTNRINLNNAVSLTDYYNNVEVDGFEIKPLALADIANYKICVYFEYDYIKGKPEIGGGSIKKNFEFDVEVYLNTNEELPSPIYDYEDLINMNDGEHYRLVSDITIKGSDLQMITKKPRSLDGNGYKILITGENFGSGVANTSNFALFETIEQDSIFKNITVVLQNRKNIQIDNNYYSNGVNTAIIVATNNGIMTNCNVVCDDCIYVNILGTVNIMENSYFGTITAVNNGYISNCRVEANISVNGASVGGLVANNEGQIVSSYIKNSRIANTSGRSNEQIATGGLVCNNTGKISMSYIEGKQSGYKIYCDYEDNNYGMTSKIIYTSSSVGGFVYENQGEIYDCYSNIPIVSTSRCAGFVAINNGLIKNAISLSKMKQKDTLNYCFVISEQENSTFSDCFFVIESGIINDYTSESNYKVEGGQIKGVITGVEPLKLADFNILDENGQAKEVNPFKNFAIGSSVNDISGVWFYTYDSAKAGSLLTDRQTYMTEVDGMDIYDVESKLYSNQSFSAGMLQLVSPNLIASSRFSLNVNQNDGTYNYSVEDKNIIYGSKDNPYLITSAIDLEEYANQRNSSLEYYRLVCDIDYISDRVYNTNLSNKTLLANFDGNNFAISNYTANTSASRVSAGLFGQFGKENSLTSTLKNVTFSPNYINLPNCIYVGGVAGTLAQAKAYNINLTGNDVIIVGKNIVGGLFGRTTGNTYISNVSADVVVKASYISDQILKNEQKIEDVKAICFDESGRNRTAVSYSGGIIGYVGGSSSITHANVGANTKVLGAISGLLIGGAGAFAEIKEINLLLNSFDNQIKAYAFGGIITGENNGTIKDVTINSNILNKTLFSCYPICPIAVGGISGYMRNGKILNISSTKGYSVIGMHFTGNYGSREGYLEPKVNNLYVAKYTGGVVGYMLKGEIDNINICESSTEDDGLIVGGGNYVGGVVAFAEDVCTISDINITLTGHKKYTNFEGTEVSEMIYMSYLSEEFAGNKQIDTENQYVGGIVGYHIGTCTTCTETCTGTCTTCTGTYKKIITVKVNGKLFVYIATNEVASSTTEPKILPLYDYYYACKNSTISSSASVTNAIKKYVVTY